MASTRALAATLLVALALPAAAQPAAPTLASPPVLRSLVPPIVPPDTPFPGPEVVVVLGIDVSAAGAVEAVRVEEGAGEPFDTAAVDAARRFEFEPARLVSGETAPVTISFRLRITPPPAAPPPPPPMIIAGRLLERGTRLPLSGVEVVAQREGEALARATTGGDGRFRLEVPASRFRMVAVSPGHDRLDAAVEGTPGEQREQTFYLEAIPSAYTSVVRGERQQDEITKQVLPAQEVGIVAGTQGDTLKAALNLPGAARPGFGGGALILRGSSPADSAAFVDGLEIPILYHFGGLRSAFAPRFLESVEFTPGNFPPDYGRLTGGIINARVRDPATDLLRGEADFNVYDAGVALEGPLTSTWSIGGAFRRSWIDTILPLFVSSSSSVSFTTAPRFYDYQLLSTWRPGPSDRVRTLFFGSQDKLVALLKRPAQDPTISGDLSARIAFHELQTSWSHAFGPSLRHESWIALGLQDLDTSVGAGLFFKLATRRVDARSTWSWQSSPRLELRGGLDLQYAHYQVELDAPEVRKEGEPPTPISTRPRVSASRAGDLTSPGAFVELRLRPHEDVSITPSLRVDWDSAIARWSADPRLFVRWRVGPGTTLKGGVGVYQQPPTPDESSPDTGTPNLLFKRSVQISAGVEQSMGAGLDLDLTAFYKRLTRVVVRNPAARLDAGAEPFTNDGTGRIYGIEALLRARYGERFFGWIAYTYQRSLRTDRPGEAERSFDFDQPHILTALGTWRPNARWAFGARFRLVSGNPYTPVEGSLYDAAADVYVPLYGAVNSGRLGTFHALDLRVDRFWTFQRWRLSLYLDVQNVYNRANQEGWQYSFDYRQRTPLTGLPILPLLGAKAEW
jgi:TonB family protein